MSIAVDTFFLAEGGTGTLQARIQQMIAEGILSGRLRRGQKLPSTRKLANHLQVSRITVTLAYTELVANDYLAAKGRSGYFVSENAPEPLPAQQSRPTLDGVDWTRAIGQRFSATPRMQKPQDWGRYKYPFIYGQTDPTLFDHANWRLCALRALGQKDFTSMTTDYYDQDDPQLVEFIARHSLPRRGIIAHPSEILVTLGAQNALWLAAQVLLTQRRVAAVENPCYHAMRDILGQSRCHVAQIDVDGEGLPPESLPDQTDVIFCTPSHHSPTSATMPLARRKALLERARALDALIVEDDYEFEMSFLSSPSPALKSLDPDGRVIYVGSFSKSLFPGLRLGYLVGPEPFIREARALRASVLRHPPGHIQRTAAYFLSLGHYDAQIRKTARAFAQRRDVMEAAIAQHGLQIAGRADFGGSAFWMRLPAGISSDALAARLAEDSVLIEPGGAFFEDRAQGQAFYRLAYSSIPSEKIEPGIARIAAAIKSMA
jgi:GntR family transcriptional regulator/MocR family aminotransferase